MVLVADDYMVDQLDLQQLPEGAWKAPFKYTEFQERLRDNAGFKKDWQTIKARFDIKKFCDQDSIIRRTKLEEGNWRQPISSDLSRTDQNFQVVFDFFCWKWFLYGMKGDEGVRTGEHYTKSPSAKNWRLTQELEIAEANTSKEKRLEKNIAKLNDRRWFNQVPTASGLFGAHTMKKASIDVVRKTGPAAYELVELKCKTNNPLYAAIEILLYGLLYIHARDRQSAMKYELKDRPLLTADKIGLRVLAPKAYFQNYDFGWFEKELSVGLAKFAGNRFKMDFKFTAFPVAFQWDKACSEEELQVSLHGITSAFS